MITKTISFMLNLIIALMLFTVLYSAANVDVSVNINTSAYRGFTINGDNLTTAIPVEVRNEGLYPVKDVHVYLEILNGTEVLYSKSYVIKEIDSLKTYSGIFTVSINVDRFYQEIGTYYAFHRGVFKVKINVDAHYWVLADFKATYTKNLSWNPLFYAFNIYCTELRFDGNHINIPYFISKLPFPVRGNINVTVSDDRGILAFGERELVFNKKAYLSAKLIGNVNYLLVTRDTWRIHVNVHTNIGDFERVYTYNWNPPVSDLKMETIMINNTPYLTLEFKNTYYSEINVSVVCHLDDLNVTVIKDLSAKSGEVVRVPLFPVQYAGGDFDVIIHVVNMNLEEKITQGGE